MFVRVIIGRRGAGKTSLLTEMADECVRKYNVCIVQTMTHIRCRDARVVYFWDFGESVRWAWINRPSVIFLDEYIVWRNKYTEDFDYVLHGGRNVDIGLVLNSQRPADIPPDVRSMTNTFYIFQLTEARDLEWVEKNINEECAAAVKSLPKFKYITYPSDEEDMPAPVMKRPRRPPTKGTKDGPDKPAGSDPGEHPRRDNEGEDTGGPDNADDELENL